MNPNNALLSAAKSGDIKGISRALADGADPKNGNSCALRWASEYGMTECVRLLLPISDPTAMDSESLRSAAENGHTDCVRLLIPFSEPRIFDSISLQWAAVNGYGECVRELTPFSDVSCAKNSLTNSGYHAAISLIDSVIQEDELKARYLVSDTTTRKSL